jgi:hypothetical protein
VLRDAHQPAQREVTSRLAFGAVYELWVDSWQAALGALTTASQSGTLSTSEAAAHKAVIATEREIVEKQLTLLLGPRPADVHRSLEQAVRPSGFPRVW